MVTANERKLEKEKALYHEIRETNENDTLDTHEIENTNRVVTRDKAYT